MIKIIAVNQVIRLYNCPHATNVTKSYGIRFSGMASGASFENTLK
jgi:hypothetical protein